MYYRPLLFCALVLFIEAVYAVEINHVYHQPAFFEPSDNQHVQVHFTLSGAADVQLKIYDDRDILIRSINGNDLKTGERYIKWDGKDERGIVVPAEAYRYTLSFIDSEGNGQEYDISDHTGGKSITVKNIKWNIENNQFEYTLKKPARVMIRIGLQEHGPLLANVLNWVPRTSGLQTEHWDGKDASGVLDLSNHPKMLIDIQAYTLSDNTILVGPKTKKVVFLETENAREIRTKKQIKKKRMLATYQQKPDTRGDYLAQLTLPAGLPKTKNNVPIVTGEVSVLLSVNKDNRHVALNRRAESVFFVDGQFVMENEVGFLPVTWLVDTRKLNEGEHFLTANIRGYEGNFGLATTKIFVVHDKSREGK